MTGDMNGEMREQRTSVTEGTITASSEDRQNLLKGYAHPSARGARPLWIPAMSCVIIITELM